MGGSWVEWYGKPIPRHSVFGELFHESPRTRRVYTANSQNRTKNCLTETCLERGSRDILGDGNLLKQYVGTCELNKCIKRHSPQKKQKNKKTKQQKNKKTKKQKNKTKTKQK